MTVTVHLYMKRKKINRTRWIHLRLSDTEHNLIKKKHINSTCHSLSQYLRNIIFERPVVTTYRNRSQDDIVQQMAILNRELAAIGNNLNQVTKKMHTLQPAEQRFWGLQFSGQAETVLFKIEEIRIIMLNIAERWLR